MPLTLSDDTLTALREAYDPGTVGWSMSASVGGQYPASMAYARSITDAFYAPVDPSTKGPAPVPLLDPRTRELVTLGMLSAQRNHASEVATHIYLALMVGASLDEVMATLLLTAGYAGVPCLAEGEFIAGVTIAVLEQVAKGDAKDAFTVFAALRQAFPIGFAPKA